MELPPAWPLPRTLQTLLFWKWPFDYLEQSRLHLGPRFTLYAVGHPPLVFLSEPAEIKELFAAPADALHPGEGADTIRPLVGDSSFMLQEEREHLTGRKAILPAFHAKRVEAHAGMVADIARREIHGWPREVPFQSHPRLRELTLRVILHTVFGVKAANAPERIRTLRDRLLAMLEVTASPMLAEPILRRGPGRATWQRFLDARAEVDELLYTFIDTATSTSDGSALAELRKARNNDGTPMSSRQLRDNIMSIVLAGHETTAAQLAWAFQLLVHHPRVLARLHAEIDGAQCDDYLTATVDEILRHRPVFLFAIPRAVAQPTVIGEWTYAGRAQLLGCIYLVHHDPALYTRPHEFTPERFMTAQAARPYWLPWGGGRKRCPGLHLATIEMKTVLRSVLATYTLCPTSRRLERPRWRSVIVAPEHGARIKLSHRERPIHLTPTSAGAMSAGRKT